MEKTSLCLKMKNLIKCLIYLKKKNLRMTMKANLVDVVVPHAVVVHVIAAGIEGAKTDARASLLVPLLARFSLAIAKLLDAGAAKLIVDVIMHASRGVRNFIQTLLHLLQLVNAATRHVVGASMDAAMIINANEVVWQNTHLLHPLNSAALIGAPIAENAATLFVNKSATHLASVVTAIANSIIAYFGALVKALIALRDAIALIYQLLLRSASLMLAKNSSASRTADLAGAAE